MTITDRLTDSDVAVRAQAAGDLTAAATALAEAARRARDRDAGEMLRNGERPADVGRTIGLSRAQMTRLRPLDAKPRGADLTASAAEVAEAVAALQAVLDAVAQPA